MSSSTLDVPIFAMTRESLEAHARSLEVTCEAQDKAAHKMMGDRALRQEKMKQIFLDMDGVLTNWVKGYCDIFNLYYKNVVELWVEGVEEMSDACGIPDEISRQKINEMGADFWVKLEPYPWTEQLIDACRKIAPTAILTNPGRFSGSLEGKLEWLKSYGFTRDDVLFGKPKELVAGRGRVLIDDRNSVGQRFREAGGSVILVPQPWNSNRLDWKDPMAYVLKALKDFQN